MIAWHTCSRFDFVQVGRKQLPEMLPNWKIGLFFKMLQRNAGEGDIAHFCNNELWIEWFCKLGNGSTFVHYFLHFQILSSKLAWTLEYRAHFIQAAVSSSCCMYWKLQTHVHLKHETKALQNVGDKKAEKPTPVAAQQPLYWPQLQSSSNFIGFDTPGFIPPLRAD